MSIAEKVAKVVEELPAAKQVEVLDFVEFLKSRIVSTENRTQRNVLGMLSQYGPAPSYEEIKESSRECWENFPREFPK